MISCLVPENDRLYQALLARADSFPSQGDGADQPKYYNTAAALVAACSVDLRAAYNIHGKNALKQVFPNAQVTYLNESYFFRNTLVIYFIESYFFETSSLDSPTQNEMIIFSFKLYCREHEYTYSDDIFQEYEEWCNNPLRPVEFRNHMSDYDHLNAKFALNGHHEKILNWAPVCSKNIKQLRVLKRQQHAAIKQS